MATKNYYKGVTIQYKGDATQLSKVLSQMDGQMRQSQAAARALDAALKLDPSSIVLIKDRAAQTERQIKLTSDRVDALKSALSETTDPEVIERISRNADVAEARLKSLNEQLVKLRTAEAMGSDSGIGKIATDAQNLGGALKSAGDSIASTGDKLTVGLTAPIAAFTVATVGAATTVDSALTDVRKTVDATEQEYQALHDAAIDYSKTNAVTAEQVLSVQALGAQLGYAKSELEMIGRVGSGLDIATDMNAEQATTDMAQFANITGMAHDKTENYASTIVALGNTTATTESKISGMAQGIAAAGTQVGMSQADILGLSAALSSVGLEADAGGSAISTIMSNIDKDVSTNSESLQTWAAAASMSAADFAEAWRTSPVEALGAVLSGMGAVADAGGNMSLMLESLGVTSLRQTDAMKRLANDASILTDTVALANDAWRENTALAQEVENRNNSLDAKLQMLQNRVTALMEQVGKPVADALLSAADAAQPLFDAIESGATAFSEMSEAEQQTVVSTVAAVAAFGPMLSITGRLASGLGGLLVGFGDAAKGSITFVQAMQAGFTATEALELASEGLSAALTTGLVGVGIAGVVVAIGAVVDGFRRWHEHEQEVADATTGLVGAMDSMSAASEKYVAGIDGAISRTETLKERIDGVIESQAELARLMQEDWADLGESTASVEVYASQIDDLLGKGKLTEQEMGVLKNAIDQVSQATGISIPSLQDQGSALALNADQIREVVSAWKEQQVAAQHTEDYNRLLEQSRQAHEALEAAQKAQASATSSVDKSMRQYVGTLANAGGTASAFAQNIGELQSVADAADAALAQAEQSMSVTEHRFSDLQTALVAAGVTGEQYESLTKKQLKEIAAAFDGTISSITGKLGEFGVSVGGTGSAAVRQAQDAADKALDGANGFASTLLDTQKETDDTAYREQQRAYQREERERSRANSKAVSAMRDAHQRSQRELRAQLDAEYDIRSDALNDAIKLEQDLNGKIVEERRKQHKRAQDELKDSLDAEYDLRAATLAKEVREQEKANDKLIAGVKKAQQKATDAYRAETKKRLKEIDAEYRAKLKLVDENDGTAEVDAQIKALNDQTKREHAEQTKREQQEKLSELRKGVEQAKSRRSRAEAEKELADYIAEIEQAQREEDREQRIEELEQRKEELKERAKSAKEALETQYDEEKTQYEEKRAAELERREEEYKEDYEKLRESLENALAARRDSNSQELSDLKDRHQAIIDQKAEEYSQDEDNLAEYLDGVLKQRRDAATAELDGIKAQHQAIIDQKAQEYSEEEERLSDTLADQLQNLRDANADALDKMKKTGSKAVGIVGGTASKVESKVEKTTKAVAKKVEKGAEKTTGNLVKKIQEANTLVRKPSEDVAKTALDSLNPLRKKVPSVAEKATRGFVGKIKGGESSTRTFAERLHDAALNPISGLSEKYGSVGKTATSDLASGMDKNRWLVEASAQEVAAAETTVDKSGSSGTWGLDLIKNLADGIWNNIPLVSDAVSFVGGVIDGFLGHSIAKEGPLHEGGRGEVVWGADLVDNFIDGMQSREDALAAQSERLAAIVESSFAPSLAARYDASLGVAQASRGAITPADVALVPTEINMEAHFHMSGMSMSSSTDIRAASRMLAAETAREINAKIGKTNGG